MRGFFFEHSAQSYVCVRDERLGERSSERSGVLKKRARLIKCANSSNSAVRQDYEFLLKVSKGCNNNKKSPADGHDELGICSALTSRRPLGTAWITIPINPKVTFL